MQVTNNFDLNQYQAINILLHKLSQPPANGLESQFYYNTQDKSIYYHNGTKWVKVGSITDITNNGGGLDVVNNNGVVNIDIKADNATLEIGDGVLRLKDSGVTTAKVKDGAITTIKIADKNIIFSKINDLPTMTVIGRVDVGTGVSSAISIINSNDLVGANGQTLVTSGAVKAYIDSRLAGIGSLQGGWDAQANAVFPGPTGTKKGDYWYVTVAGTIFGVVLQVGDVIVANQANPNTANANHYIFLQTNADQATTTVLGLVMLASIAETQAGTNNQKAVTPATLSARTATETRTGIAAVSTIAQALQGDDDTTIMTPAKVKAVIATKTNAGYDTIFGNSTAIEYQITHGLNTTKLVAEFFDEPSKQKILVDYKPDTDSTIFVTFGRPPGVNRVGVVIIPKG